MIIEEVLKRARILSGNTKNKSTKQRKKYRITLKIYKKMCLRYINCHMPSSLIELLRIIINHLNSDKDIAMISGVGGIVSIRGLYSGLSELLKIMNLNETISCHRPHNLNLRM